MIPILIDYQTQDVPQDWRFPSAEQIQSWYDMAAQALALDEALELTLRLVDNEEMTALNRDYRGKDYATNVLSFPCEWDLPETPRLLGDIVIAVQVVNQEALQQHKTTEAHWAHICIHGLLHLLGYDHIEVAEAEMMENEERKILALLGFSDPYLELEE